MADCHFHEQLLSELEKQSIMKKARNSGVVDKTKFYEQTYKLKTGLPAVAAKGLEYRLRVAEDQEFHRLIGNGVEGIEEEVD